MELMRSLYQVDANVIREQYMSSREITMLAHPENMMINWSYITFGNFDLWLFMDHVLDTIGITPEMLRSVFEGQKEWYKKVLPNEPAMYHCGIITVRLPAKISCFGELGNPPCTYEHFIKLARALDKSIRFVAANFIKNDHEYFFTAHPCGLIEEAPET